MPPDRSPLRPDASGDDYVEFYDDIGAAQLEESYYARHAYAVARHHLLLGLLAGHARSGAHLLDVGCASGYYSVRYAAAGGRVTGVDVASSSVELARERAAGAGVAERTQFRTGDLRGLPFPDHSFDVALATEVLEHVREQREALAELTRVLRPGGTLVVSSPGALDDLAPRRRRALRKARSAEEAGVRLERLGHSETLDAAGIEHEPYFHDAFTLPGLRMLLPSDLVPVRLCSLLFVPPRAVTYAFLGGESIARRLRRRPPAPAPAPGGLVQVPDLYGEASALLWWTRANWRMPARIREGGTGVLLVGRRAY